jgi:hypothetical protein
MDQTPRNDSRTVARVIGLAQDLIQSLKTYATPQITAAGMTDGGGSVAAQLVILRREIDSFLARLPS